MTLKELGLTEADFDIRVVNGCGSSKIKVIIDGIMSPITASVEMVNDWKFTANYDIDVEAYIIRESINWYINDIKFIRKLKLKKIKEKYEN